MSIVNLNKARKDRAKALKRARADENSAKFGRSKQQKKADQKAVEAARAHVDQHKRDT